MPTAKNELIVREGAKTDNLCRGGRSFNCKRTSESADPDGRILGPHQRSLPVYCRKCDLYMGCSVCAERIDDMVCLRCNDWATDAAERQHGKMVPHDVALRELKKIVELAGVKKIEPASNNEVGRERDFYNVDKMIALKQLLEDEA